MNKTMYVLVILGFSALLVNAVDLKRDNSECFGQDIVCPSVDGKDPVYIPVANCSRFCECSNGVPYLFDCPAKLHFNPTKNVCDWPEAAGCKRNDECAEAKGECPAVDGPDSVYLPLPDCTKFCQCSNGKPYLQNCPEGLYFNPVLNVCDWPQDSGCGGGDNTPKPNPPGPQPTTPSGNDDNGECAEAKGVCPAVDGPDSVYLPLPDCTKFCQCSNGKPYLQNCPDGLYFNPVLNVCDWPEHSGCQGNNDCAEANGKCPAVDGPDSVYLPLPDCTKFCQCSNGKPYLQNCPDGLYFNPILNVCDWPQNAGCQESLH